MTYDDYDQLQAEYEARNAPCASPAEALDEYAVNAGETFADSQWILTPWDVWVQNPKYQGPPQKHPEDDSDLYEDRPLRECADFTAPDFDDCPF
jgi:hypothetical protein